MSQVVRLQATAVDGTPYGKTHYSRGAPAAVCGVRVKRHAVVGVEVTCRKCLELYQLKALDVDPAALARKLCCMPGPDVRLERDGKTGVFWLLGCVGGDHPLSGDAEFLRYLLSMENPDAGT